MNPTAEIQTSAKRRRLARADAQSLLSAWRESGVPLSRFARERGVSAAVLYGWRARLGEDVGSGRHGCGSGLAAVRVTGEASSSHGVTLVLPSGLRVLVPSGWSAGDIAALCGALSC